GIVGVPRLVLARLPPGDGESSGRTAGFLRRRSHRRPLLAGRRGFLRRPPSRRQRRRQVHHPIARRGAAHLAMNAVLWGEEISCRCSARTCPSPAVVTTPCSKPRRKAATPSNSSPVLPVKGPAAS